MLFPDSGSSASAASAQAVRCSLGTRLLGSLAALGVVSCVAILQYQPEERLVDTLGFPQVKHRLQAVLSRTLNPRIIALDITESDLRYRTPTSGHLMGFQDGQSSVEIRLMFARVERIDVYQSHVVFVRDKDDKDLAHLAFATEQDAKMFADLLMSLRAVQLRHPPRQG